MNIIIPFGGLFEGAALAPDEWRPALRAGPLHCARFSLRSLARSLARQVQKQQPQSAGAKRAMLALTSQCRWADCANWRRSLSCLQRLLGGKRLWRETVCGQRPIVARRCVIMTNPARDQSRAEGALFVSFFSLSLSLSLSFLCPFFSSSLPIAQLSASLSHSLAAVYLSICCSPPTLTHSLAQWRRPTRTGEPISRDQPIC